MARSDTHVHAPALDRISETELRSPISTDKLFAKRVYVHEP